MNKAIIFRFKKHKLGQSLVEFAMVIPIVIILGFAAYFIGMAMYHGSLASTAIKSIENKKMELAQTSRGFSGGDLLGMVSDPTGNINVGAAITDMQIHNASPNSDIMLGSVQVDAPIPLLQTFVFDFSVSDSIQAQLLKAIEAPINPEGWLSDGANLKPTEVPALNNGVRHVPEVLEFLPDLCAVNPEGGAQAVNVLAPQGGPATGKTYVSYVDDYIGPTHFTEDAILKLATQFADMCTAQVGGSNPCAQERANLTYRESGISVSQNPNRAENTYYNPPGAPGKIVHAVAICEGVGNACLASLTSEPTLIPGSEGFVENPQTAPPHGKYWDPSGAFVAPPADFESSCVLRKIAECQIREAVAFAAEISDPEPHFEEEHCWSRR